MNKEQIVKALRLFNEKTEKLRNSNFVKKVQEKSGVSMQASSGGPVEVTRFGPDQEEVDAFVLSLRFLIQDNETSSFRNLAKVYESPSISQEDRINFRNARDVLKRCLDSPTTVRMENEILTRRELLDTFVYGGLAHANKRKKERHDSWMVNKCLAPYLTNDFIVTVSQILKVALFVKQTNERVLEKFQ